MRRPSSRSILIVGFLASLAGPRAMQVHAQSASQSDPPAPTKDFSAIPLDGIAARIEDDIILESEVHELGAFQILSDDKAKPRNEIIRELADQWIVRGEANAAKYPFPTADEIENAYQLFVKQFPSPEEFRKRLAAVDLTEGAVKRTLAQQLYLAHFLDYRFRAAAQVDDKEIEKYYNDEFAPQLKARNEPVPPLEDVEDTIREVLVQRAINDRAEKWLDDARQRLKIDVVNDRSPS
jgi:hypothetical protein